MSVFFITSTLPQASVFSSNISVFQRVATSPFFTSLFFQPLRLSTCLNISRLSTSPFFQLVRFFSTCPFSFQRPRFELLHTVPIPCQPDPVSRASAPEWTTRPRQAQHRPKEKLSAKICKENNAEAIAPPNREPARRKGKRKSEKESAALAIAS